MGGLVMRKSKKLFIGVLSIVMLLTVLTACSRTEVSRPAENEIQTPDIDPQLQRALESRSQQIESVVDRLAVMSMMHFNEDGSVAGDLDLASLLRAEIVVIGEFINESQSSFAEHSEVQRITAPHSFNQLLVTEVLQGDVNVGDVLTVSKGYALDEHGILHTQTNFTPMNQGDRWIYSLSVWENAEEYFEALNNKSGLDVAARETIYITGFYQGRFPVPTKQLIELAEEIDGELKSAQQVIADWLKSNATPINDDEWGVNSNEVSYFLDYEGNMYRLTLSKDIEFTRLLNRTFKCVLELANDVNTTSAFGVYQPAATEFNLYLDGLEHFNIEPQNWQNPGQRFDARLIEMAQGR
jgi:hypothetical protein